MSERGTASQEVSEILGRKIKNRVLRLISGNENLIIDQTDGTDIFAKADDLLVCINPNEESADEPGQPAPKTAVEVYEMIGDGTFSHIFGSLLSDVRKLCLTQAQIKVFAKKHKDWLRTEDFATFSLFKSYGELFVSGVRLFSLSHKPRVCIDRFDRVTFWFADRRCRVVVLKLA
jgi:hypothetical protein